MKSYNLIVVYNESADRVLLCRRRKKPYQGRSNFVGGKIEAGEDGLAAAYRELWEETAITESDITLTHFMDLTYHADGVLLEVYVGKLRRACEVAGDENELYWSPLDRNFFDAEIFAGNGNMGHILAEIARGKEKFLQ